MSRTSRNRAFRADIVLTPSPRRLKTVFLELLPRTFGLALIAASLATTLAHRAVYEAAKHGPAQLAEFALGLASFALASAGILLAAHGRTLFEPVAQEGDASAIAAERQIALGTARRRACAGLRSSWASFRIG